MVPAVLALFLATASAPQGNNGTVSGIVRDGKTLDPLAGVVVTLNPTAAEPRRTWTDAAGTFWFDSVGPGLYTLEFSRPGYRRDERTFSFGAVAPDPLAILLERQENLAAASGGTVGVRQLQVPDSARKFFRNGLRERDEKLRVARSIPLFHKAIELFPEYDEAYVQLGVAHLLRGELDLAEQAVMRAVGLDPQNPRARALLGKIFLQQGKTAAAVVELDEAVQRNPAIWNARLDLAWALLRERRAAEALPHARGAHQLNPASLSVHTLLYSVLLDLDKGQEALAELDEILRRFAGDPLVQKIKEERARLTRSLAY